MILALIDAQPSDRYNYTKLLEHSQLPDMSDVIDLVKIPADVAAELSTSFDDFLIVS